MRTAYDWFVRREDADFAERPTVEKARELADWINSHDCRPVTEQTVFDWMYEEHLGYIESTMTWNK